MADFAERNIYYIPPGTAFLPSLMHGLHERFPEYHDAMDQLTIWLPNKALCKEFVAYFALFQNEQVSYLPSLRALGDLDITDILTFLPDGYEFDPPSAPLTQRERLMQLVRLIQDADVLPAELAYVQQLPFEQLAQLVEHGLSVYDELIREEIPLEKLHHIVPEDYANNFHKSIALLSWLIEYWPQHLQKSQSNDQLAYRHAVIHNLAGVIRQQTLEKPLIIAGSTGSNPAIRLLLDAVSRQECGAVILPALDSSINQVGSERHPFFIQHQLLEQLQYPIEKLTLWHENTQEAEAKLAKIWLELHPPFLEQQLTPSHNELSGTSIIESAHEVEEAKAIALVVRDAYESQKRTAICLHDRRVLPYITAELDRFALTPNILIALPLKEHLFFRLWSSVIDFIFPYHDDAALWKLLISITDQSDDVQWRRAVALLKAQFARQDNADDITAMLKGLCEGAQPLQSVLELLSSAQVAARSAGQYGECCEVYLQLLSGLSELLEKDLGRDILQQAFCAERLNDFSSDTLQANAWLHYLLEHGEYLPRTGNTELIDIVSPLEGRFIQYEHVIFTACNEGVWPALRQDGLFNEAMRKAIGLPGNYSAVGKSAFDVLSMLAAPEITFTYSTKRAGHAALPSPWLLSLAHILRQPQYDTLVERGNAWTRIVRQLENADQPVLPVEKPYVKRYGVAFPTRLSIGAIERLCKNPYEFYAKYILRLDRPDGEQMTFPQVKGIILHHAMELWAQQWGNAHTAVDSFSSFVDQQARAYTLTIVEKMSLSLQAQWIEVWLQHYQQQHMPPKAIQTEATVSARFVNDKYLVYGRLDRVDEFRDKGAVIIDYKTGTPPYKNLVYSGLAPQLPLQALLYRKNYSIALQDLAYWKLAGKKQGIEMMKFAKKNVEINDLVDCAEESLNRLLKHYEKSGVAFLSCPHPGYNGYNPYQDLSRDKEWRYG